MTGDLALGGRLWRSAIGFFHDWRHRSALQREFQLLGHAEGERILRDCGLPRSEFMSSLHKPLLSEDLLSPAMLSVGLDPVAFKIRHPARSRDLERICMACDNHRRCRNDASTDRFASRYRDYCPNRNSFDEIAEPGEHS